MISHMLDTNMVSYLMRTAPAPSVRDRLRDLGPAHVSVSVITALELRQGADLSRTPDRYHQLIDALLGSIPILPLPVDAAAIGGALRATLQQAGTSLADMDSLIASHALTEDLVLVTNDAAFARVPNLQIENWVIADQA